MKYEKAAIFLSVRDKATRLPGKISKPIEGKMVIEHLIDRLKRSNRASELILTTSIHSNDAWLESLAASNNILCFKGSEDDKLLRYLNAADAHGVDFCVIVDGDDLFCDPGFIDRIIEEYYNEGSDYIIVKDLPLGVTGFGVKTEALRKVVALKQENDTEIWGSYFTESPLFQATEIQPPKRYCRPDLRMTLDYQDDLEFFMAVFKGIYSGNRYMSLDAILDFLDKHPEISQKNQQAQLHYEAKIRETVLGVKTDVQRLSKVD